MSDVPAPHRTQQERSAQTRARLVDAAFACLLEVGYAGTTVGAVQQRAGVARGTLLHHFPTRSALMVGVVEDIAQRRLAVLSEPGPGGAGRAGDDWDALVDLVWSDLRSPAFTAALELWVAARTDHDLRAALVPVQERLFGTVHRSVTALVGDDDPRVPTLVQFSIDLLTGSRLAGILEERPGTPAIVERWRQALHVLAARPAD